MTSRTIELAKMLAKLRAHGAKETIECLNDALTIANPVILNNNGHIQ